jgi:hypothetical protein
MPRKFVKILCSTLKCPNSCKKKEDGSGYYDKCWKCLTDERLAPIKLQKSIEKKKLQDRKVAILEFVEKEKIKEIGEEVRAYDKKLAEFNETVPLNTTSPKEEQMQDQGEVITMDQYLEDLYESFKEDHPQFQGQELERNFASVALAESKKLQHLIEVIVSPR